MPHGSEPGEEDEKDKMGWVPSVFTNMFGGDGKTPEGEDPGRPEIAELQRGVEGAVAVGEHLELERLVGDLRQIPPDRRDHGGRLGGTAGDARAAVARGRSRVCATDDAQESKDESPADRCIRCAPPHERSAGLGAPCAALSARTGRPRWGAVRLACFA